MDATAFAAIVGALLGAGGIGGLVAFRKAGRETESLAVQTMASVNDELRKEIKSRDAEIRAANEQIRKLRERVAVLEDIVRPPLRREH